nr:poly [ADP-ribose] polymerase tankyrase-2-like [Parasteatoda tepidariorum]
MDDCKTFDHAYSEIYKKILPEICVYPYPPILSPILEMICVICELNDQIKKLALQPKLDSDYVFRFRENKIQKIKSILSSPSVQELIPVENWLHENCLHFAVSKDNVDVDVVEQLLTHGADPNRQSKVGDTPLHVCARYNRPSKVMEILLKYGGNPNKQNQRRDTPLHIAARKPDKNGIIKTLLENGADIRIPNYYKHRNILLTAFESDEINLYLIQKCLEKQPSLINSCDVNRRTPLHLVMRKKRENKLPILKLLLDSNADVNATDAEMKTPLHWMRHDFNESELEVIQSFIDRGADINAKDREGRTPIFYAINNRMYVIAKKFIALGAKVNVFDKQNRCILGEAVKVLELGDNFRYNYLKIPERQNFNPSGQTCTSAGENKLKAIRDLTHIKTSSGLVCLNNEKQFEIIQLLLENGADPDAGNISCHLVPFHFGDCSAEKLLVQYRVIKSFVAALSKDEIKNVETRVKDEIALNANPYDDIYIEDWYNYRNECISEVSKMTKDKLNKQLSVFKFVAERCSTGSAPRQTNFFIIDEYLLRLNSGKYPHCQDVMYAAIKRDDLEWRLLHMLIYTPRTDFELCNGKIVALCSLVVAHIMKYLSKYDLINLAIAYQPLPVESTSLKRSLRSGYITYCCKHFKKCNNL